MSHITPISFLAPDFHAKAWGSETWLVNNDRYCAKILDFIKDESFSDHFHWTKEETWYVVDGKLLLEYYDLSNATRLTKELNIGDIIHVPPGNPHKLTALQDSKVLEVSTRHEDSDSYRIGAGSSQIAKGDSQSAKSTESAAPATFSTTSSDRGAALISIRSPSDDGLTPSLTSTPNVDNWSNAVFNENDEQISTGIVYEVTAAMRATHPKRRYGMTPRS